MILDKGEAESEIVGKLVISSLNPCVYNLRDKNAALAVPLSTVLGLFKNSIQLLKLSLVPALLAQTNHSQYQTNSIIRSES